MSESVSAMSGAAFEGIARVTEAGLVGMITLRGDLPSTPVATAVKVASDAAVPGQREIARAGAFRVVWMSPDELLITCEYAQADAVVASLTKSLEGEHFLAVNVSDARAVFDVSGANARDVLAKVMPVDFSAGGLGTDMVRRSRLAQVPAAVWVEGEDRFRVVCFRSVGRYVFDVLSAAAVLGSEVNSITSG